MPEPSQHNGTFTLATNGTFTYNPVPDYNGVDTFTYKVNDGTADSNVATVSITITPTNDAERAYALGAMLISALIFGCAREPAAPSRVCRRAWATVCGCICA